MHAPSLNMSNLIAPDAPLLSPGAEWDHPQFSPTSMESYAHALNFQYLTSSSTNAYSHVDTTKLIKRRNSPDTTSSEQQCIPTHQVFDFPPVPLLPVLATQDSQLEDDDIRASSPCSTESSSVIPAKRSSSTGPTQPSGSKKPRAERVTTKDFIPPDVTGLSKREARLVKNRAAAFLSRQRKREEFENMEVRVAELEQENARLLNLAKGGAPDSSEPEGDLLSEVELLRRQLAKAQERERELNEQLSRKTDAPSPVKMETVEHEMEVSSRSASVQPQGKSGASFGLMVLLCALPTLLSVPTQSALPSTFTFPLSDSSSLPSSSSFDFNSFVPGDYDWGKLSSSSNSIMDLDGDHHSSRTAASSAAKKLEFVDGDSEALGLNGLDISFDAQTSDDGKIRVRIHPSSSAASTPLRARSPALSDDQSMWGGSDSSAPSGQDFFSASSTTSPSPDDQLGPFLGIGSSESPLDFGSHFSGMSLDQASGVSFPLDSAFDFGPEGLFSTVTSSSSSSGGRKRVRIALKSMPGEGREGGEWEVQLC